MLEGWQSCLHKVHMTIEPKVNGLCALGVGDGIWWPSIAPFCNPFEPATQSTCVQKTVCFVQGLKFVLNLWGIINSVVSMQSLDEMFYRLVKSLIGFQKKITSGPPWSSHSV